MVSLKTTSNNYNEIYVGMLDTNKDNKEELKRRQFKVVFVGYFKLWKLL